MAKRKKTKMPTRLAPGTREGNKYLARKDRERKKRGFHGRTLGGARKTASKISTRYKRKKTS